LKKIELILNEKREKISPKFNESSVKKNNKKKDNYGVWPLNLMHYLIFNFIPNRFILSIPSEYCATLEDTLEFLLRVATLFNFKHVQSNPEKYSFIGQNLGFFSRDHQFECHKFQSHWRFT
jgi:hypothetical protein